MYSKTGVFAAQYFKDLRGEVSENNMDWTSGTAY